MNPNKYFLPYQLRWLNDKSKIKIWEKSRRIGATYIQSYEDVKDCVEKKVPAVWFSSADESAAREYITYCEKWTKLFDKTAKYLGSVVIDSENPEMNQPTNQILPNRKRHLNKYVSEQIGEIINDVLL